MSTMESLFNEIRLVKQKDQEEFNKIKYTKNKNSLKKETPLKSKIVQITSKDQVYEEMKSRFRSKWKSDQTNLK